MLTIGTILYVSLLLINAMAVLSEDRFLVRSKNCSSLLILQSTDAVLQLAGPPSRTLTLAFNRHMISQVTDILSSKMLVSRPD